jgi:hypothetical protein
MARNPETYAAPDLFEIGLGEVVVCRFKNDGRVEAGIFLVDIFCLGVKNAFFDVFPSEETFRNTVLVGSLAEAPVRPGAWGRKLIEGAVNYAKSLGISPHSDYKKGAKVFGGIQAGECDEEFVFGREGRPFFIQGPDDDPATCERIHTALRIRLGEDGYDFEMAPEEEDGTIFALDSAAQSTYSIPSWSRLPKTFWKNTRISSPMWCTVALGKLPSRKPSSNPPANFTRPATKKACPASRSIRPSTIWWPCLI